MATSWRDPRPAGHDELVAICLKNIDKVIEQCGGEPSWFTDRDFDLEFNKISLRKFNRQTFVERPCGGGFIDVAVEWVGMPVGGPCVTTRLIVEVKSERETWNAGDVLRQLKRYKNDSPYGLQLTPDEIEDNDAEHRLALFAGRSCTNIERTLLEHEGVTILGL